MTVVTPRGASSAAVRSAAVFVDPRRALPVTSKIFTLDQAVL
jgi:hypothetical protein